MNYDDDDRWEFAPEGEGRITPDVTDSRAVDDDSYERPDGSLENDHIEYPDTPGPASHGDGSAAENRCECGTSIAPDRTKCDFCLTNNLDYGDFAVELDTERKLTGLIHVLVDAKTEHNAIYKGLTCDPFTTSVDDIDECEVIADLEGELVERFTREWEQLPDAAAVDTTEGQRQLDIIRQNADHDYTVAADDTTDNTEKNRPTLDPVLFDAEGEPISDIEEVGQLIASGTLERTVSRLIGIEIDELTDDRLIIRNLLDVGELSLPQTIAQLRQLALEMQTDEIDAVTANNSELARQIDTRTTDIDRLFAFVNCGFHRGLERAAAHATRIATVGHRQSSPPADELYDQFKAIAADVRRLVELALAGETADAVWVHADVSTPLEQLDRTLYESDDDAPLYGTVVARLQRTADCGIEIAETPARSRLKL